jgi:hypothetical protein
MFHGESGRRVFAQGGSLATKPPRARSETASDPLADTEADLSAKVVSELPSEIPDASSR